MCGSQCGLGGNFDSWGAGFYLSDSRLALEGRVSELVTFISPSLAPVILGGHPNCFAWVEAPEGGSLESDKSWVLL